jgi:chromosome segregation ATPase
VIEQALFFALGFLLAGLIALAFAPAFWRRALRLTRHRLEAQVPLSVEEILASRDHLRAEFAVERRKLEIRTAEVTQAHAVDRGELGRKGAEVEQLKGKIASLTEEMRSSAAALSGAHHEIAGLSSERGALTAALYDADGLYRTKQEELATLNQAHHALSALADERLASHAASDARAAGLELRLGDVSRTLVEAEKRFTERTAHAARLNDALVVARSNLEVLEGNYAILQKKFDAETARVAELGQEIEALRGQRDADQGKLRALGIKLGVHEAALEDARQRENEILAQRDQHAGKVRDAEQVSSEKYENLRAEFAALQGALELARRRCEILETELQQTRAGRPKPELGSQAEENASLRQGVSEIGTAIARLAQANDGRSLSLVAPVDDTERADFEMTNQSGS